MNNSQQNSKLEELKQLENIYRGNKSSAQQRAKIKSKDGFSLQVGELIKENDNYLKEQIRKEKLGQQINDNDDPLEQIDEENLQVSNLIPDKNNYTNFNAKYSSGIYQKHVEMRNKYSIAQIVNTTFFLQQFIIVLFLLKYLGTDQVSYLRQVYIINDDSNQCGFFQGVKIFYFSFETQMISLNILAFGIASSLAFYLKMKRLNLLQQQNEYFGFQNLNYYIKLSRIHQVTYIAWTLYQTFQIYFYDISDQSNILSIYIACKNYSYVLVLINIEVIIIEAIYLQKAIQFCSQLQGYIQNLQQMNQIYDTNKLDSDEDEDQNGI